MPRQEKHQKSTLASPNFPPSEPSFQTLNQIINIGWRTSAAASLLLTACAPQENRQTEPAKTTPPPPLTEPLPSFIETSTIPPLPIIGLNETDLVNEFPNAHQYLTESIQELDWVSGKSVELSALIFSPSNEPPEVVILATIDGFPHIALRRQQGEDDQIQTQIEMSPLFVSQDEQGNVLYFTALEDEQGKPFANPFLKEVTNSDGTQETWGYLTNGSIVKSPTDLSNPFTTHGKLASAIPAQNLTSIPTFDEALNTYTATNLEGNPVSWSGQEWQRLLPTLPDWATTAIEVEQATTSTINGTPVILRAFRENETADNTPENERILFILNQETNQWEVPLPSIEQSYAKYVNPFKTKTFATRELDSYAPELFEIPSLEPEYLRHWLQEFSKEIVNNDKVEAATIDIDQSSCHEMGNPFASTITCVIVQNPWSRPVLSKIDNYLILSYKIIMPLTSNSGTLGIIHTVLDYETLNNKQEVYWQTPYSWLEGLEASFYDQYGNTKFISPIIGPRQDFSSFPGEEKFRTIMDLNNPDLAEKLFTLISTKGREIEDKERETILKQMSETIIPSLYQLFDPQNLPPNKTDWTITP